MLQILIGLMRSTLLEPRGAARYLLKIRPEMAVTTEVAVLVVVSGTILSVVVAPLYGDPGISLVAALMRNPLLFAVVDMMALMISVIAVHVAGRMFGGTGTFDQAFLLVVWLQALMLVFQVVLLPVLLVSPPLAVTLTVAANLYLIWLFVNFVAILHGFRSLLRVFAGFIATSIALSFVIFFFMRMMGLGV